MPTLPSLARKAMRSSPISLIFLGGPSRSGSSSDNSAGSQNRRRSSPIGVPLPLRVRNSLSAWLSIHSLSRCCFGQSLLQIGDDVVHRFDPYRQANYVWAGAGGQSLLVGELAVRRRRGMDNEAFGIADDGQVRKQLDAVHHLHADLIAALDTEGEYRPGALGQVFLGQRMILVRRQAGVVDPGHGRMLVEVFGNLLGVGAVALHAQAQRLDAEHGDPGVERRL